MRVRGSAHSRPLSDRIEQMREEERARLARELHDELGQLLTGIKLDFSAALRRLRALNVPGDVVDRLQSAIGQIEIGIVMVRRIASDLRPGSLDHEDLGGAVDYEVRKLAAQSGLRVTVSNRIETPIDRQAATAAFRIFQEAMTNAIRHSRASTIAVRLRTPRGQLVLSVRDNGVGMAEELRDRHDSLGLIGMRERARELGGDVRIASQPGRGTEVELTLPLRSRSDGA